MSDETKSKALAKLDAFRVKIGYPDKWRDYAGWTIDRGPFVFNVMRATRSSSSGIWTRSASPSTARSGG